MYWTRKMAMDRLHLTLRQSYRILPPGSAKCGYVATSAIMDAMNSSLINMSNLTYIPTDILNEDEMSECTGIPKPMILKWARRKHNPLPNIRFNQHCTRFLKSLAVEWLENAIRPGGVRRTEKQAG